MDDGRGQAANGRGVEADKAAELEGRQFSRAAFPVNGGRGTLEVAGNLGFGCEFRQGGHWFG